MTKFLATTAVALMLASPVWAQSQSGSSQQEQSSNQGQASAQDLSKRPSKVPMDRLSMLDAHTLMDSAVLDAAGKKIGKVSNVVIDPHSGQVAYAIISANGKQHVVPWQRLQPANKPQTLSLNANRQALEGAPTVNKNLAEVRSPQDQKRIAGYWQNVQAQQAQLPSQQGGEGGQGGQQTGNQQSGGGGQ